MTNSTIKKHGNLSLGIYFLCVAIIVAFLASNFFILSGASKVADSVQYDIEADLVRNETALHLRDLAVSQSKISYWDETVFEIYRDDIDMEFVYEEIAGELWEDEDISQTAIVGFGGDVEVAVLRDIVLAPSDGQEWVDENFDLIQQARTAYFANRVPRGNGFITTGDPIWSKDAIYAADFRIVEDRLGMVVAQAIVPDILEVLPDGNPKVLVTFRPINKFLFAAIRDQLGLKRFSIVEAQEADPMLAQLPIGGKKGGAVVAVWEPAKPSQPIWDMALPIISAVTALTAFGLIFFAAKYGKIVRKIQESEEHNKFMAEHDALTGLPNRLQFDKQLDAIVEQKGHSKCAILCMDLDKFKQVNDTYGHLAGDVVIKTVADRLAAQVGDRGLVARIGGDEFIILLRNELSKDSVMALCDGIIDDVSLDIAVENGVANVGASIGAAWWPDDARTAKTVISAADKALYRAKEQGRGQAVCASDPILDDRRRQADRRKTERQEAV